MMFHKTLLGATISDLIMLMIFSGSDTGIKVFDYFTVLERDQVKVKAHPENYLPWNDRENSELTRDRPSNTHCLGLNAKVTICSRKLARGYITI
jgi:hypothetical protein